MILLPIELLIRICRYRVTLLPIDLLLQLMTPLYVCFCDSAACTLHDWLTAGMFHGSTVCILPCSATSCICCLHAYCVHMHLHRGICTIGASLKMFLLLVSLLFCIENNCSWLTCTAKVTGTLHVQLHRALLPVHSIAVCREPQGRI